MTSDRYSPIIYKGGASSRILGERVIGPSLKTEEGIEVHRLPVAFEIHNMVYMIGLEDAIRSFSPDAIHVHEYLSMTCARIAKLKKVTKGTRLVIDEHRTFSPLNTSFIAMPIYYMFKRLYGQTIIDAADAVVAATDETRRLMERFYGIPGDIILTIPLGCDTKIFRRDATLAQSLAHELGIDSSKPVFCYVGRIREEKGVHLFVDAVIRILSRGIKAYALVVGGADNRYLDRIRKTVSESGFRSNFIFIDAVPNRDLCKYYSLSSAGVWPKQCSISMVEAMSCSVPIVISNRSGAAERVSTKKTGLTYEEGSVEDLTDKMIEILDPDMRVACADSARAYAVQNDWECISDRFEELYSVNPPLGIRRSVLKSHTED